MLVVIYRNNNTRVIKGEKEVEEQNGQTGGLANPPVPSVDVSLFVTLRSRPSFLSYWMLWSVSLRSEKRLIWARIACGERSRSEMNAPLTLNIILGLPYSLQ